MNKQKVLPLLSIVILFLCISLVSATTLLTANKIRSSATGQLGVMLYTDENSDYLISGGNITDGTTFNFLKSVGHNGYVSAGGSITNMRFIYDSSSSFKLVNYSGSTINSSVTDAFVTGEYNYGVQPKIKNGVYPIAGAKIYLKQISGSDVFDKCTIFNVGNEKTVIANDDSYVYAYSTVAVFNGYKYTILDYDCAVVYSTNNTIDGNEISNFSYIRLDEGNNFFVALQNNSNKIYTFDTALGGVGDVQSLTSYNITISGSGTGNQCDYDQTNNIFFCIGKRNGVNSQFDLLALQLNNVGDITDITVYNETMFNNIGYDSYSLVNPARLFIRQNYLYLQLYDSLGGTYDLFKFNSGTQLTSCTGLNYTGLTCYNVSNTCLCYDENSVCFPNNEIYQGINSSNYVCNTTIVDSYGNLYCGENLTYCAGGCTNTPTQNIFGTQYTTGTCVLNDSSCTNDCVVEGYTYSDTATSYKQCGFYDADVCLDWSNSIPCGDGYYSNNGFCYAFNTSGFTYYTQQIFKVQANITGAFTYSLTTNPPESTYKTGNAYQIVGFDYIFTPTSVYINKNCDYTETNILQNNNLIYVNTTQDYTVNGYTNGISTIKFIIPNNGTIRISGLDTLDRELYVYNVTYNQTTGFCLYNNVSLLGCQLIDYSYMKNLELDVQSIRPNTNQLFSAKLVINLLAGGSQEIYRGFANPLTIPASNYGKIRITTTNANVTSVNVINGEQYLNAWKNTTWTQLKSGGIIIYQHSCIYSKVGCYTVRSYLQQDLREGLWDYQDWKVCINSLSGASIGDTTIEGKLSPMTKLVLALAIPVGIFLLLFILGWILAQKTGNDNMTSIFSFAGLFFSIGFLVYFSIKGWLPAWIIIVMFLASAFIIVMLVRGMFAGRNEM